MRTVIVSSYPYEFYKFVNRAKQIGFNMIYQSGLYGYNYDFILPYLPVNIFSIVDLFDYSKISDDNHLLNYFDRESLEKLKQCDDSYLRAAVIVRKLFKDKKDKSGDIYINHLISVSDGQNEDDNIVRVAGLLHDTVEDTDVTCMDLLEVGFSKEVVETVFLVTKTNVDYSVLTKAEKLKLYEEEIDSIISSGNNHALKLKINDMTNNYNPERLSKLPEDKQEWFREKYGKQLVKLKNEKERRKI